MTRCNIRDKRVHSYFCTRRLFSVRLAAVCSQGSGAAHQRRHNGEKMEPRLNKQGPQGKPIPVWGWMVGLVLLAIALGWGSIELAGRSQGEKTLSSYHRTNQKSGQSVAARQGPVVPKTDPSTAGRPQNANENAREIVQAAAPLHLSDEQRQKIMALIAATPDPVRINNQPFTVSIGAAVPQQVPLKQIPTEMASLLHAFQGDNYVLVGSQLVIVDASVRRVVAIIPEVAPM